MKNNDSNRFEKHYLGARDGLYAFVLSMIGNPSVAEDVCQDISVVLWRKFDSFEEGTSFPAWARQIALYEIHNARRKIARAPVVVSLEADQAVIEAFDRSDGQARDEDRVEALYYCMETLSPSARELVTLRYFKSRSLKTIAARFKRTVDGVNSTLCKIRRVLESCIRKRLEDGSTSAK
jgi:RNA polymerase sigma-70 factor (ECF subfamily)